MYKYTNIIPSFKICKTGNFVT